MEGGKGEGWEEGVRVSGGRERKGEKEGKWEGGLDLDICPGAPEFPVTPR